MTSPLISTRALPRSTGPEERLGFSLVELVIALGVATFGLIAILGLFGGVLSTSKQADNATAMAVMSLQVADQLRGGTNSTVNISTNFYFDSQGSLTNSSGSPAYYQCQLSTTSSSVPNGNLPSGLVSAELQFSWPATVPAAARTTKNMFATAPYRP